MTTHTTLTVQKQQASTYNHPCGDLLDRGSRREYLDIVVPLYRASIRGDLKAAEVILKGSEYLVRYSITEKKETPLHVAAVGHSTEFVSYLVNMMSKVDLELQNRDGNTAFCLAVISGNIDMVKIMAEKNRALRTICGSENMMPLYLAAFHGNHDMVTFLYNHSNRMRGEGWTNDNMNGVLLKCIQADIFDVALRILEDNEELPHNKHVWDVLQVLARKPRAFPVITDQQIIIQKIIAFLKLIRLVPGSGLNVSNATPLLRLLWKRIMEKPKDIIDKILRGPVLKFYSMETYPSQILFIAAKLNNIIFLVELIREYPDLIWKTNDDGQTIFHTAAAHRHRQTYNLLYDIGSMKDLITPITDGQGNNILHLVGKNPEKNVTYHDLLTTPFQVHSEFLWFKEVSDILPPPCREVKNEAGQTPHELFIENHKDLVFEGVKWINETINQSMVVATLVCTIGFSIVFQIPGGFDQNNGFPIFLKSMSFTTFILLDTLSFTFSTSSILMFLSVILSRRQGNNELLLRRWMLGQGALLYSIITLIFTFAVGCFVLYRRLGKEASIYSMYGIGSSLLIIYLSVYYSLFKDAAWVAYSTKEMFRQKKTYALW